MKKKFRNILFAIAVIMGLFNASCNSKKDVEQTIIKGSGTIEELSIDEKISRARYILIGKVTENLPSVWKHQNYKDAQDATSEEIFDAGGLFTDSFFSVDRVIKGNIHESSVIRVRTFQGETKLVRMEMYPEPTYLEGHTYLLMITEGFGPTSNVDPGYYISINSDASVYEIIDGKAIALGDEWDYEELVEYIETKVSQRK